MEEAVVGITEESLKDKGSSSGTYTLQAQEALLAMQKRLPAYVVNCLIAAGYDTLSVISNINTSKEPGNTLQEIEDFINSEFPQDSQFLPTPNSKSCKFLPSHRYLIEQFIKDLQPVASTKLAPAKVEKKVRKPRSASKCTAEESGPGDTLDKKLSDIRRQVVKWQRKEKTDKNLKCLQERKDYEIKVNTNGATIFCCFCRQNKTLGINKGKAIISNWSRHVAVCIKKSKHREKSTLQTYFPTEKRATSTDATGCSSSAFSEASNLFALTDFELAINTDKQSDSDHYFRLTPPLEREGGPSLGKSSVLSPLLSPISHTQSGGLHQSLSYSDSTQSNGGLYLPLSSDSTQSNGGLHLPLSSSDSTQFNGGLHIPLSSDSTQSNGGLHLLPSSSDSTQSNGGLHLPLSSDSTQSNGGLHLPLSSSDSTQFNGGLHIPLSSDSTQSNGGLHLLPSSSDSTQSNGGLHLPLSSDSTQSNGGLHLPLSSDSTQSNGGLHLPLSSDSTQSNGGLHLLPSSSDSTQSNGGLHLPLSSDSTQSNGGLHLPLSSDSTQSNGGLHLPLSSDSAQSNGGLHLLPSSSDSTQSNGGLHLPLSSDSTQSNGGLHLPLSSDSTQSNGGLHLPLSSDSTQSNGGLHSSDSTQSNGGLHLPLSSDSTQSNGGLHSSDSTQSNGGLHLLPSSTQSNGSTISSSTTKVCTDWSRSTRKRIALLKVGSDPKQTKMTSFFETVLHAVSEVPGLNEVIQTAQEQGGSRFKNVSCMLKELMENAEKNSQRCKHGVRHQEVVKKFATSLLIYCGPMAYRFLQTNLATAIPSLRSVQRIITRDYKTFIEGDFRFEDLLDHLNSFNAAKIVTIGEDATRIIGRVEYDSDTNKLVGFVLPCNSSGLPLCDTYIVNSFQSIEEAFAAGCLAKYAFVYMVKPLCHDAPAFCLGCLGTNNRFDADLVLKRWKYIVQECNKRGIMVTSFGADGDSRELCAMQTTTQVCLSSRQQKEMQYTKISTNSINIPTQWSSWFAMQAPTHISYVQDIVHLGVKLKARLLKPSIILPMGKFLAGSHDLRLVQQSFGKDRHAIRERDINHKDRQNFDAVLHLTSDDVLDLLSQIPDAKGTLAYLKVIRYAVDSYLDKSLDSTTRLEKIWFAVFFVRYWRGWLLNNPNYTLGNNFITTNAYVCLELNAHSLITFLITLRDSPNCTEEQFLPWMLGSQSCEKIFRAARSMTSFFSTMINFNMLGLLRRLHRLHIQVCLESESAKTGIKYPTVEAHKLKDGCNSQGGQVKLINNESIVKAVKKAQEEAQRMVETLGMAELLKEKKCWEYPPISTIRLDDLDGDDDDDNEEDEDEVNAESEIIPYVLEEANLGNDPSVISSGIDDLANAGLIDQSLCNRLTALQKAAFKRVPNTNLPTYELSEDLPKKSQRAKHKFSHFVEIIHKGKSLFIHKTTAVWLMQEGERISSDRLFRVRSKQPFATQVYNQHQLDGVKPLICAAINIGDLCVFRHSEKEWRIGRVLQFSYFLEKTKKASQYSGSRVDLSGNKVDKIGVLCSWYSAPSSSASIVDQTSNEEPCELSPTVFSLLCSDSTHRYYPISTYICTLSLPCFDSVPDIDDGSIIAHHTDQPQARLAMLKQLKLNSSILVFIQFLFNNKTSNSKSDPDTTASKSDPDTTASNSKSDPDTTASNSKSDPDTTASNSKSDLDTTASNSKSDTPSNDRQGDNHWLTIGRYVLSDSDKEDILNMRRLNDRHVSVYMHLIKQQHPHISGLQNTVLQQRQYPALKRETKKDMMLQIIHIQECHWAAIRVQEDEVLLFDTAYTSISNTTVDVISKLLHYETSKFTIKLMNVSKQVGDSDCGLFAIAILTSLALGKDPLVEVYRQDMLRAHYLRVLESGTIQPFPLNNRPRPRKLITSTKRIRVYCYCRMRNDGTTMYQCSGCKKWYHERCIKRRVKPKEKWFCNYCKK